MRKRLMVILLPMLMLATSVWAANNYFTLIIDPGHGGKDHGAPGSFSKEKDLTLKFALAFGRVIEQNCPDVKVVFTRKTDTYLTLANRAALANRCKGDLFVSVHINAVDGFVRHQRLQVVVGDIRHIALVVQQVGPAVEVA